ncbi:MAG: UbiA family prenyltransferase [Flavobacteriales bacterium]
MRLYALKDTLEKALRMRDWRFSFIPVIFGLLYLFIQLGAGAPDASTWLLLFASLLTSFGFASFGYLLNEWTDISADAQAGKPNKLAHLTTLQRTGLMVVVVIIGGLPWFILPTDQLSFQLIFLELCLFIIYSLQPLRLKNFLGISNILDAGYAYVVPIYLAKHTFSLYFQGSLSTRADILLFSLLFCLGLRNILIHQINDLHHDQHIGQYTLPSILGLQRTNLLLWLHLGVELLLLLSLLWLNFQPWYNWGLSILVFGWIWISFKNEIFSRPLVNQNIVYHPLRHLFDPLYQLLLPLFFLSLLLLQHLLWWPLLLLHAWLFIPKAYLEILFSKTRIALSYVVNYSIWFLFLLVGVNLKNRKQSALQYLKSISKK